MLIKIAYQWNNSLKVSVISNKCLQCMVDTGHSELHFFLQDGIKDLVSNFIVPIQEEIMQDGKQLLWELIIWQPLHS